MSASVSVAKSRQTAPAKLSASASNPFLGVCAPGLLSLAPSCVYSSLCHACPCRQSCCFPLSRLLFHLFSAPSPQFKHNACTSGTLKTSHKKGAPSVSDEGLRAWTPSLTPHMTPRDSLHVPSSSPHTPATLAHSQSAGILGRGSRTPHSSAPKLRDSASAGIPPPQELMPPRQPATEERPPATAPGGSILDIVSSYGASTFRGNEEDETPRKDLESVGHSDHLGPLLGGA